MKLRDLVEYVPARAAEAALGILPLGPADRFGLAAGSGAWRLGTRRDVVEEQIAAGFPDRDAGWVTETTRACYRHFGKEIAAIARLGRSGGASLLPRFPSGNEAVEIHREVTGGGGAIIVTGHIGNWEVAGAYRGSLGRPQGIPGGPWEVPRAWGTPNGIFFGEGDLFCGMPGGWPQGVPGASLGVSARSPGIPVASSGTPGESLGGPRTHGGVLFCNR